MTAGASVRHRADVPPRPDTDLPLLMAASVRGKAHYDNGTPCQDAFAVLRRGGIAAIAVADGLGSAQLAHVGAAAATGAAVAEAHDSLHRLAEGEQPQIEQLVEIVDSAFEAARASIDLMAGKEDGSSVVTDYACTLILAIASDRRVVVGHVGDGAVVALTSAGPVIISDPGDSEYVDEVEPITDDRWRGWLRCSALDEVRAFAVFTDGCQRAALKKGASGWDAHAGFFSPVFDFAESADSQEDASKDIEALLGGRKMSETSEDDKTLVLAVLD